MQLVECGRKYASQILAIYNEAVLHSTAIYVYRPRPLEDMEAWFDAKERGSYPVIGAVDANQTLLGFGSYGPFRDWPAYKYSVEHSVYVERSHRQQGVGASLLEEIVRRARQQDYHNLIGGIDSQNTASIALHLKCGFEFCGRIKQAGFKFNRWLDLDFYQRTLETPENPQDG